MQHFCAGRSRHYEVAIRLIAVLLIAVALAGCGKKGAPQPPPDEPNTFPRSYPNV
jgi:predicted small lipoprotein YifL